MVDERHEPAPAGATSTDSPAGNGSGCQFPTGPSGRVCGRPIERSGGPGAPARYCELPGHNRAKAFAARRAFALAAVGGPTVSGGSESGDAGVEVLERPVTDGRASFGALLAQFGEVAGQTRRVLDEQQAQLVAVLARAEEVARTVADPEAAAYEVEQVQRETGVRLAEAQSAQATAERDAREARRRGEQEAEQRAQADDAAEQALREVEAVRAETAETLARITAETDARVAEQTTRAEQAIAAEIAAREELDRVRAEAAEQVTAAQQAARAEVEQARAEITAAAAERVAAAEGRAGAAVQVAEDARRDAAEAATARTRAEAGAAAAERRAGEDRAAVEQLRAELAQVRREAVEERAALRQEAREQLAAILTQLSTTANEPGTAAGAASTTPRPGRKPAEPEQR